MLSTCRSSFVALTLLAAACGGDPDAVLIELAPDVISSEDGTMHVSVLVIRDRTPQAGEQVELTVTYTDRNGEDHAIDGATGPTDERGRFEAVLEGMIYEGVGTVTATVVDGAGNPIGGEAPIQGQATFSVLDRTPPVVTILPPTTDLRIGPGLPLSVEVEVSDEIGISEVFIEASGEVRERDSTVIASGATTATLDFNFDVPDDAIAGPTITLHALAADLSGNLAAAEAVVLTVDPAINIATPPGLVGEELTVGNNNFLENPRALALSPMDGLLYVADNSANAPCNGACVRSVDPATGDVNAGVIINGQGDNIEGIAFDATGDTLFFSDRQNRVTSLTWNGAAYDSPVDCNNVGNGEPQDPMHLVHDATLGLLVVENNAGLVQQLAICNGNDPANFTAEVFDNPVGIAAGAAGEFYVSDADQDRIVSVADDGSTTLFEARGLDQPRGLVWLEGGPSDFADSLLIANRGDRDVASADGVGRVRRATFLRNPPVDLELSGDTLFILTEPGNADNGRIFKVTGF